MLSASLLAGFDHVSTTTRGFTGHEMLDEVGIIHMNGRIYDPKLGRFLQADPIVQSPTNTQSLNRYSYGFNNPLNATDPSGHIVFTLAAMAWAATAEVVTVWSAAMVFGAAGFADALVQGAGFGQALKAGIISGISAAAFTGAGEWLHGGTFGGGTYPGGLTGTGFAMKIALHGFIGGTSSLLQGGKFGSGFAAAGFTALGTSFNNSSFIGGEGPSPLRVLIGATIGGTASEMTGGKFANGAVTGAFSQLMNNELTHEKQLAAQQKGIHELAKEGGIARLIDGAVDIDEALDLAHTLRSATDAEIKELFPHLQSYNGLELSARRYELFTQVRRIGLGAFSRTLSGAGQVTSDAIVGLSVDAAAGVLGVPKRVIAVMDIAFTAGSIPNSHQPRRAVIDRVRERYE